jgi:hypothetical protein
MLTDFTNYVRVSGDGNKSTVGPGVCINRPDWGRFELKILFRAHLNIFKCTNTIHHRTVPAGTPGPKALNNQSFKFRSSAVPELDDRII